jgi:LPXTG-site transpeptidase (sortase) family protein
LANFLTEIEMVIKRLFAFTLIAAFVIGFVPNTIVYAHPEVGEDTPDMLGAVQLARLTAPHPAPMDRFGWSVAISGDTAVIGAPSEDLAWASSTLQDAGAAYVFVRQGNQWNFQQKITAKNPQEFDNFGTSVDIDGNTIVVGANGREVDNLEDVGAAYVFGRQGFTWSIEKILTDTEPSKGDNYGVSVAIDNGIIAVGADGEDLPHPVPTLEYLDAGKVYLYFERDPGKWLLKKELQANDPKFGGSFGSSVALEGDYLVVGATELNPYELKDVDLGPGSAYIFSRSHGWSLDAKIDATEDKRGDAFGYSVAVSGSTVLVGAPSADPSTMSGTITNAGKAYMFNKVAGVWRQTARLTLQDPMPFDYFGRAVDLYGSVALIGAEGRSYFDELRAGAAYLFTEQVRGEWSQQTTIRSDAPGDDEAFGRAVSLDGNKILIGASGSTTSLGVRIGKAFVYGVSTTLLPSTGFPPCVATFGLADTPANTYNSTGDMTLSIPVLGVDLPIVSVPKEDGSWNVDWLWGQAGYLEGTAFPTWRGNTGIAGHVYLPNGNPGPFLNLHTLKWGDQITITAWGETYQYEVRQVFQTDPQNMSVLGHEDLDWVTLVTCKDFDENDGTYTQRSVVRAVRVK